jgi:hypothetical protein
MSLIFIYTIYNLIIKSLKVLESLSIKFYYCVLKVALIGVYSGFY